MLLVGMFFNVGLFLLEFSFAAGLPLLVVFRTTAEIKSEFMIYHPFIAMKMIRQI